MIFECIANSPFLSGTPLLPVALATMKVSRVGWLPSMLPLLASRCLSADKPSVFLKCCVQLNYTPLHMGSKSGKADQARLVWTHCTASFLYLLMLCTALMTKLVKQAPSHQRTPVLCLKKQTMFHEAKSTMLSVSESSYSWPVWSL